MNWCLVLRVFSMECGVELEGSEKEVVEASFVWRIVSLVGRERG